MERFDGEMVTGNETRLRARHEYGPFGEVLRATGPVGKANPLRFSNKYEDDETGTLYYGYRFYDPSVGRWNSRDTIGEQGGQNLYGLLENAAANRVDLLGMCGGSSDGTPGVGCPDGSPCSPNVNFSRSAPQGISTMEEIRRRCANSRPGGGVSPACATLDKTFSSRCEQCKDCQWRIIYQIDADCKVWYADPAKIPVTYPQGLDAIKHHEDCHCDDYKSALTDIANLRMKMSYDTFEWCESSRKEYERIFDQSLQTRMRDSINHKTKDGKFDPPNGSCYATADFK
jgi:RHS repeat-associated protein